MSDRVVCTIQHILLHLKTPDMDLGTRSRYDNILHMASDAHANVPDIVIQVMSKTKLWNSKVDKIVLHKNTNTGDVMRHHGQTQMSKLDSSSVTADMNVAL